jgi:hypothetical protein
MHIDIHNLQRLGMMPLGTKKVDGAAQTGHNQGQVDMAPAPANFWY